MLTCVFVVLGAMLLLAPAQALASPADGHLSFGAGHATPAGVHIQRLGDTTYSISGHVLDYAGKGVAGAEVDWGWWSSISDYHFGGSSFDTQPNGTDSSGAFSIPSVTGGHQVGSKPADDLTVYYLPTLPGGLLEMRYYALDFATNNDATSFSYEMQPAEVNVDIAHAPAGPWVGVTAGNGTVGYADANVRLTAGKGLASVLPMTSFDDVAAYTYNKAGESIAEAEWLGTPASVSAGTVATGTVNLDWHDAQYAYLAGPTCRHSGKSGTKVKLVLKGWPAGEKAEFVGFYYNGGFYWDQHLYLESQTSTSPSDRYTVSLKIPRKVPVGLYEFDTWRADNLDSLVNLLNYFQVCTFRASANAIHRGTAIRLSGKVPGHGYVTIYSTRRRVSGQPWTLAAKGWVRGGRYHISSSGEFLTGLLHPTRTSTYVAKYSGDNFPAFTSVVKVKVWS